jgi:hypothetical protein
LAHESDEVMCKPSCDSSAKNTETRQMDGRMITIRRLRICDDMDRLHVKIDNINDSLVRFCFIRSIDYSVFNYNNLIIHIYRK